MSAGTDSRYFRGFAFKPTREGTFKLTLSVYRNGQWIAAATCPGITVTP